MTTNGNESAFAMPSVGGDPHDAAEGLTKREYFAAKCLEGLLADSAVSNTMGLCDTAVEFADGLIDALNKTQRLKEERPSKGPLENQQ